MAFKKGRGFKKATDREIIAAYSRHGSCKGAAEQLGMCAQSVHERLVRLGANIPQNTFSEDDVARLRRDYSAHAASGSLDVLAAAMGRTKFFLCARARELGLTDKNRPKPYLSEQISIAAKERIAANGHPRGMLGKKHTPQTIETLSRRSIAMWAAMTEDQRSELTLKQLKSRADGAGSAAPRNNTTWKSGWREIGGIKKYYRSKWEANYACYLEWLKNKNQILEWKHEPKTFWFDGIKRGCVSYLPDFLVTELGGAEAYHEVKGWMDDRSATKIKRMAKYFPDVKLIVIDAKAYASLKKTVQFIVPGWES